MKYSKKIHSRRLRYAVGMVIVLAIIVAGVIYFRGRNATAVSHSPPPVPVTEAVATLQNVPVIVSALGTVQSIDSVAVQARVNGPIVKIEFKAGQVIKEGQELFLIDPRPFQAVLDETQAQLAHDEAVLAEAQLDLTRYQNLAREKSIATQQAEDQAYIVEQDKGTVQIDQANVETAQLNLAFCHVTAPITGRAGVLMIDVGNLVGPSGGGTSGSTSASMSGSTSTTGSATAGQASSGTTMVMLQQTQPIYVTFNVPQDMLGEIKTDQAKAPLEVDAYSQAGKLVEKGTLTVIDNQINVSAGTVMMQGTFANADEALWPGEFVRAQLIVSTRKNAVTVPSQSVMAGPNGSYVYVINADQTVHRVNVDVIERQGNIAVIGKGLSSGENVVVDGQYRLANGVKIAVQQAADGG
jgi:membrane fusion protein, multidrug efflux system